MAEFNDTSGNNPANANGIGRVADVAPALRDQATKLADKSVSTGVEAAQAVGKAVESAAEALDDALPMLAGYVRNAAQYTNQFADSLTGAVLVTAALFLLLQAAVLGLVQGGMSPAGATLLVAAACIAAGLVFVVSGRKQLDGDMLTPDRTIHGIQRDSALVKEKLT